MDSGLPRVSGGGPEYGEDQYIIMEFTPHKRGGPDISFDEWMKLEFPPRKRGSRAKHRPELLLRKAGSWACIGYCQRTKYMAPVFAGTRKMLECSCR